MRLTSVAVGYNFAQAIVGGSSPALATYLVDQYGLHSPGFMVSIIALFSVTGLCMGTNTKSVEGGNDGGMYDTEPQSFMNSCEGNDEDDDDHHQSTVDNVVETELI
jgi:hypothetical protein